MKIFYRIRVCCNILFFFTLCCPVVLTAQPGLPPTGQPEKELPPVTRTYAITNATVFPAPGQRIDQATIVVKDGLIKAVGKNIAIPPEAIVIKGDSLYVYAGFIDGLSRVGVNKPKEDVNRERPKDPANPTPEVAGITPHYEVRSFLNPEEKSLEELRALGFSTAQVVPYGKMLPGSGAIILLTGKSADEMLLVNNSVLFSELIGMPRVYPTTLLAVMAKWRELYRQAQQAKNYENLYATNRTGLNRPPSDRVLEAFYPVIDKRIPVLFEADDYLEIHRIINLKNDLGFSLMMGDVKEGWDVIPKIKAADAKIFLSLDLPPEEKKDAKGNTAKRDSTTLTTAEKEALEKRKADALSLYAGQAANFQKAGLIFGFSSLSAKSTDIRSNLRRMIKEGLTEDQALAALTTSPATILGLSDRLGTIENGKIANLVLSDKPYFDDKSKVRYVFVDGIMYKYDPKDQPKTDARGNIEITGTWAVTTETPAGKSEESLTFKKEGSTHTGSITGGRLPEAVTLEVVELTGSTLKYSYTVQMGGQTFKVDVEAHVEGNTFKGTATVGQYGIYPVEGKKDPRP